MLDIEKLVRRINKGESQSSIAEELGMNESSLRGKIHQNGYRRIYVDDTWQDNTQKLDKILQILEEHVVELKLIKKVLARD